MRFDLPLRNEVPRTFSPEQADRIRDRVFAGGIGRQVRHAQSCGSQPGLAHADKPIVVDAERVRSDDAALSALIREATDRSPTFRHLKDRIQVSDGLVYIVRGRCGHYRRACLAFWVGVVPPNRLLRIVVDYDRADEEAMATIAHELRHALEVLDEPNVRSAAAMFFFYKRNRSWQEGAFETQEAVDAGHTVRRELRERD